MKKEAFIEKIKALLEKDTGQVHRGFETYRIQSSDPLFVRADDIFPTDQQIVISPHVYEANELYMEHSHDYFELIYAVTGFCEQTVNGKPCSLRAGDILLLSPRDTHAIATSSRDDILLNVFIKKELFNGTFLNLISDKDFISNFFLTSLLTLNAKKAYLHFPNIEDSVCADMLHALILEFYERKICWSKNMECLLALFFAELVRIHQQQVDEQQEFKNDSVQLTEILCYISDHMSTITLSLAAEHFHYHPNYLSALLKRHTQQSFTKILMNMRLQEACYYLKNTALPIDEILEKIGHYDRSYFHRVFKKHYHMTPNEYRKRYGGRSMNMPFPGSPVSSPLCRTPPH